MMLSTETYVTRNNGRDGKWKQGLINVSSKVSQTLNWKKQKVHIILMSDEEFANSSTKELIEKIKQTCEALKLKKELEEHLEKIQ